ncbi:hypothetical protein CVS40_6523 [Lucilia cuprina]|nr:hypothetical protein CVS40_6523 [Lucilia cuprina]
MYASTFPSYTVAGSYIDVCISDCRINVHTLNNTLNCLETLVYDSDHNAIQILASMNNEQPFSFFQEMENVKYNFKRTNWKKI